MTFYFYDLETSGINPKAQRIMQFAGQRTDDNFKPIGEPQNWLIKLTEEILPDPDAVLITGITPQKTFEEGYTEAEFLRLFHKEVLQPDTVIMGFNTIRFDDEFMRATLWRNFYDPYEWQWQDGRSRWDLLDVVRMVRALRPEGIKWPFDEKGQPTNRLELLTKANGLGHDNAHDALSDVQATIALAKLLKQKQPQMFDYLFKMRGKKNIQELVNLENKKPFVYTSGRYENDFWKTTVAFPLTIGNNKNIIVYDLRYDPTRFVDLSEQEIMDKLFASWEDRKKEDFIKLPIKQLNYSRAPVVSPLGVLTQNNGWQRVKLDPQTVQKHLKVLLGYPEFAERVRTVYDKGQDFKTIDDFDFQLYDGFVPDNDKVKLGVVRSAVEDGLSDLQPDFTDERLTGLLLRYKARNYPTSLNNDERLRWEDYRKQRLVNGLAGQLSLQHYISRLSELAASITDEKKLFILKELQLYAESIIPAAD